MVDAETVNNYLYDQGVNVAPQVTPTNVIGRLAHATSPTGAISLSYDAFGSVNARVCTGTHGATYAEKRALHADDTRAALATKRRPGGRHPALCLEGCCRAMCSPGRHRTRGL